MKSNSHRLLSLSAAALLLAAAGCSATDDTASVSVPEPPADQVTLCRALDKALPKTVAGLTRGDPDPKSELTAAWGDAAIVLRCGVPRPAEMDDSQAKAVDANGVNWLLEQRAGGPRFTSTYRKAYVEVTLGPKYAHDVTPLSDFAGAIRKTDPSSL
ncbi:DUF3515 domain-containing protein [Streptomyces sp. NBC_00859]|uniref:DUF3515 domain-containing protein n=1 Tax=Streptomyces sp. NBC_00859 TaxID=2903682 RepID=UPI00386E9E6D|nr:DUF3515 domain-containing protein [Streptomyces sp. NBC_00859]